MRIWFKSEFVDPILSGQKRDTIRRATPRYAALRPGSRVSFSVGPRPAFASAVVTETRDVGDVSPDRLRAATRLVGDGGPLIQIFFRLEGDESEGGDGSPAHCADAR